MSQAASSRNRAGTPIGSGGTIITYLLVALIALPVLGLIGLVALISFGSRSGEEISVDTFSRRSFGYVEEPFSGTQIFPISRESETGVLENHLQAKKLLKHGGKPASRWDLYKAMPQPENPNHLDARILVAYLDMRDATGNLVWLDWSVEHPHLAEILWPEVGYLARSELYVMLPELFRHAEVNTPAAPAPKEKPEPDGLEQEEEVLEIDFGTDEEDKEKGSGDGADDAGEKPSPKAVKEAKLKKQKEEAKLFRRAINKHLSAAYTKLAGYRLDIGENEAAITFSSEAIKRDPANLKALKHRAAAYKATGKEEKAAADRAAITRLEKGDSP